MGTLRGRMIASLFQLKRKFNDKSNSLGRETNPPSLRTIKLPSLLLFLQFKCPFSSTFLAHKFPMSHATMAQTQEVVQLPKTSTPSRAREEFRSGNQNQCKTVGASCVQLPGQQAQVCVGKREKSVREVNTALLWHRCCAHHAEEHWQPRSGLKCWLQGSLCWKRPPGPWSPAVNQIRC